MNFSTKAWIWLCLCLFTHTILSAQTQTANDIVQPYDGDFRFGMNQGYFPPWSDGQLAEIAAGNPEKGIPGVGVKALRPSLPEWLMEIYGYDFRKSTYEFYETLGMTDHTVIVEGPADWHRDLYNYCGNGNDNDKSRLFANLYSPIWDNGENGTPVNDTNYLALYLYKTASIYKDHIKFYEIWNEPDFFFGGDIWNYRDPNNSWWVRDPDPCEYQLHAPIQHYVRTLRISYEVIKSVDPDAYVSIGALGMPHFLDAVLRNTDNPVDGSPTAEFPLGGGAYFDVMGYHEYPHIDGSLWSYDFRTDSGPHSFLRNSDRAVENGIYRKKDEFERVLFNYGYDGSKHPEKLWIITESNVPRTSYDDPRYYGSDEMQRNYIIKAAIGAMKEDILQFHPFTLGDKKSEADASYEFDLMGMYKKLRDTDPYTQEVNDVGIAYKTVSDMLFGTNYDVEKTAAMNLPDGVEGGAFVNHSGNYTYALWAKTTLDKSETASAMYSFPDDFGLTELEGFTWNYGYDETQQFLANANAIELTGAPLFFSAAIDSTTCGCDTDYVPVCDAAGNEYSNACVAACAGVAYENCATEVPNVDLEIISLTANPSTFRIFSTVTFTVVIENVGTETISDIVLAFPIPQGKLAYVNANATQGDFRIAARHWNIGTLEAGERAELNLDLFTLTKQSITVYTQIIQATGSDLDSAPNNGNGIAATEDDEAHLTIEYVETEPYTVQKRKVVIELQPNPARELLSIRLDKMVQDGELRILNAQGKLMQRIDVEQHTTIDVNIEQLAPGSYWVLLRTADGVQQTSFIKQ